MITKIENEDMTWNGDWDFTTSVNENKWIAEIKIPFSDWVNAMEFCIEELGGVRLII